MPEFYDNEYDYNIGNQKNNVMKNPKEFEPKEYSENNEDYFNDFIPKDEDYEMVFTYFIPDEEECDKNNRKKKNELLLTRKESEVSENILYTDNKIGIATSRDLEENEDLAEFVCIILGDGHMHKRGEKSYHFYGLSISLNRVDERQYVKYVYSLTKRVTGLEPKLYPRKGNKGIDLKLNNKKLIYDLISKGILTGDKVKNQVYVPNWVKNNEKNVAGGLRGLFDTDGSVWINRRDKNLGLSFKNASKRLVSDFINMSEKLGIKTGKIVKSESYHPRLNNYYTAYQTQIIGKTHIKKFLDIVKPKKWEFKKKKIEETLKLLGTSIEEALKDRRKK